MFVKIDGLNITVALLFFGEVSVACYGQWCDHSPRRTGDPPKKADVSALVDRFSALGFAVVPLNSA